MHVLFVALQILLISNFVSTGLFITNAAEVPPPTSSEQSTSTQSTPTSATPSPSGSPSTTPSATSSPATASSSTPSPPGSTLTTPSSSRPPSTTSSGTPTPTTSSTASTKTTPCTTTGRFAIKDPNCQKYYYCYVDGTNIIMYDLQCPNSLLFNPTLQKCVLPASYLCPRT